MLREISEEVRVNLKDRLRDMRHAIRQHRHGSSAASAQRPDQETPPPFPIREIEALLGRAASAFDDAISIAETFAPHERAGKANAPKGFAAYFSSAAGQPPLTGERAFRRDMYHLAKAVLARKKIDGARVLETNFVAIHASMFKRHKDLVEGLGLESDETEKLATIAGLSSALLIECLNHQPLRFDPSSARPIDLDRSLEISCLAPIALGCGLASIGPGHEPEPDGLEMATLAVDARLERIVAACRSADPLGELTAIFAMLLFHLR